VTWAFGDGNVLVIGIELMEPVVMVLFVILPVMVLFVMVPVVVPDAVPVVAVLLAVLFVPFAAVLIAVTFVPMLTCAAKFGEPVLFVLCAAFVELGMFCPGTSPGAHMWLPHIGAHGCDAVHGVPPPEPAAPTCWADAIPYPNVEVASIIDNIIDVNFMALGSLDGQLNLKVPSGDLACLLMT
jgi:hypothetical protein